MNRVLLVVLSALLLSAPPASGQNLTPEDVARAYVEGITLCAKAKLAGGGIAQLGDADQALVAESSAQMRPLARAAEGRPVWDVLSGRGIVVISEPDDARCDVTAYGPRVRPVFERAAQALTTPELGFVEVAIDPDPSSILRAFERVDGARRIRVVLDGGEPGMPGRMFRFPLLLGAVRVTQ